NDFRINYLGDSRANPREALLWSSQVQLYYDVNEFRKRLLTDAFINELNLPPDLAANVKHRQFRPDLAVIYYFDGTVTPGVARRTILTVVEDTLQSGYLRILPSQNLENISARTRGSTYASLPPMSLAYDSGGAVNEYAELVGW